MEWRLLWRSESEETDVGLRFRQLLSAAQETDFYRETSALTEALHTPIAEFAVRIPELIGRFPVVEERAFQENPARFHSHRTGRIRRPRFFFPLKPFPRTALVFQGVAAQGKVRHFSPGETGKLAAFRPEVLAGPVDALLAVAAQAERSGERLPELTRGVVVYTGINLSPLDDALRDELYARFEVPIYEQFLGPQQELLAWECQAHDGLHIKRENGFLEIAEGAAEGYLLLTAFSSLEFPAIRLQTRMMAGIERSVCDCGSDAPRLMPVRAKSTREDARAAAHPLLAPPAGSWTESARL